MLIMTSSLSTNMTMVTTENNTYGKVYYLQLTIILKLFTQVVRYMYLMEILTEK